VSTGDILSKDYRLFLNMTWTPCSSHALNLVLQDQVCTIKCLKLLFPNSQLRRQTIPCLDMQLKIPSFKKMLRTANADVTVFKHGPGRKLFMRCEPSDVEYNPTCCLPG
jgi:hypothetical protein